MLKHKICSIIIIFLIFLLFSSQIFSLTLSKNPEKILSVNDDIFIASGNTIYKLKDGLYEERMSGHTDYVIDLTTSNDNSKLYSASWDKTIREWNISTAKSNVIYRTSNYPKMIRVNPQQNIMAILEEKVILYNLTTNKTIISKDFGRAGAICWDNDGTILTIGKDNGDILFWYWEDDKIIKKLKKHSSSISGLMYNPKGDLLLSADKKGMLYIWGIPLSNIIKEIDISSPIYSLDISYDGYFAFVGNKAGDIEIIDLDSYEIIESISGYGRIITLATSSNGKYLYAGSSDRVVYKIDLNNIPQVKERMDLPCNLVIKVTFNDDYTYYPNKILEGTETGELTVNISNTGNKIGTAYATRLTLSCDNRHIAIISEKELGDIPPGKTKEVTIPIKCDLNAVDGNATITINAKEKRGYDAQPVQIVIPVLHIEKPNLVISDIKLNDATLGLAKGNGNNIPENGETIELIAYIENRGSGVALGSTLDLVNISRGIDVIVDHVEIGRIEPGNIEKAKVAVRIPREFSGSSLDYAFSAKEVRGACPTANKSGSFSMGKLMPMLTYTFIPPDDLRNGGSAQLTIIASNEGQLDAQGVVLEISEKELEVTLQNNILNIGTLQTGKSSVPLTTTIYVHRTFSKPILSLTIELTQAGNFNQVIETRTIPVTIVEPELRIVDRSNLNKKVMQNTIGAELVLAVENVGKLDAKDVKISVYTSVDKVNFRRSQASIGTVLANASLDIGKFIFDVPQGVDPGSFPIHVRVTQSDFPPVEQTLNYEILERGALVTTVQPGKTTEPPSITYISGNQPSEIVANIYDGQIINSPSFQIDITVVDNDGLSSVNVSLNGRNIFNSQTDRSSRVSDKSIHFSATKTCNEGENIIEIIAEDSQNIREKKTIKIIYERAESLIAGLDPPFSDVDVNLPKGKSNPNSAALIIGIRDYMNVSPALFADRDAIAYREYCHKTLGVPEQNIVLLINEEATLGQIRKGMIDLKRRASGGEVYIFYSGHGVPDKEGNAYLLPYDGDADDPEVLQYVCYPMKELYQSLEELNASHITIFMDACFSGTDRSDNAIIAYAKPVAPTIDPTQVGFVSGKITQLNSSTGSQFSAVYDDKKHGVFTYFLLKGLRGEADNNQDGKLTFGELSDYVTQKVIDQVHSLGYGEQTPTVNGENRNRIIVKY